MPFLRSFKDDCLASLDLGVILMIGIAFIGLLVVSYIIYIIKDKLITSDTSAVVNSSIQNITSGWDSAVNLLLIAITIFILALAISALLLLRGR